MRDLDIDLVVPDARDIVASLHPDGVLVTFLWDDEWLDALRFVQSISAGHTQYPHGALQERGIVLASASGVHAPQVAEHAFGLLLSLTRGIGVSTRHAVDRRWKPMMLDELTGRTIGILGLGAIGEEIARRADAWGLRVIGTKRNPSSYHGVAAMVVPPDETARVFAEADVVISVLPGGAATDGIVTVDMLRSLDGWFVNVGRGDVVDPDAILQAIDEGRLKGAGLDVFPEEPLPEESPLWSNPRVVLTPHTAGFSPMYGSRLAGLLEQNLAALAGEGPWVNRVV